MSRRLRGTLVGLYDAVFRPERLVMNERGAYDERLLATLRDAWALLTVYLVNLMLYAGPLTAAGFGTDLVPPTPAWLSGVAWLGAPATVWTYAYAFVQNSVFLLAATVLTFVTVHVVTVTTLQSRGFLQTAYTVVYSTSAYLAGLFTVVWYLSTASGVTAAKNVVINVQKRFIYAVIDALGADVGLPSGRPDPLALNSISRDGTLVLSLLVVLVVYYFYSLYLGTRINHRTGRTVAALVVAAVATSPVIYVGASVIIAAGTIPAL